MATTPTILIVQHEDGCPPGWLGDVWQAGGAALDVRTPYRPDDAASGLPSDLSGFAALVVLGGAMGAHDDAAHDWLEPTKSLLRQAIERELPTLGVCLGHQLIGAALGGRSARNPAGQVCGRVPIALTPDGAGDPLLGGLDGRRIVQWNDDVLAELPAGAMVLSTAPDGSVQAARFGRSAWGLQFHPEASPDLVAGWSASHETVVPGAGARAVVDIRAHADELRAVNDELAERFLAQVTERLSAA